MPTGEQVIVSEAVVKMLVDGQTLMSVAEGNGPVNALDLALRKDLGKYQHEIDDLELVDYKVRILNGGTEARDARADRDPPMQRRALVDRSAFRTTSSTPRSRR